VTSRVLKALNRRDRAQLPWWEYNEALNGERLEIVNHKPEFVASSPSESMDDQVVEFNRWSIICRTRC